MRFITALEGGRGVSSAQLEVMTRECWFGRIFRDLEGDLLLIYDVLVFGVTVRWFLLTLNMWKRARTRAMEMAQQALAAAATRGPGSPGEPDDEDDPEDVDLDDDDDGDAPRQARAARTVVH